MLIHFLGCVHLCQPIAKLLDVWSHGMFPIVQKEGRLTYGLIHNVVHSKFRCGQHFIPSVLTILSKGFEVIFQYPIHYLCLSICLKMVQRTHFYRTPHYSMSLQKNADMDLGSLFITRSVGTPWRLKILLINRFMASLAKKSILSGASLTIFMSWSTKTNILAWS